MNRQIFIASAVFSTLVGCATSPDQIVIQENDLSQTLPATGAGISSDALYFSTAEDAAKALVGYNYGLKLLVDGTIQAFVSGLNGSGLENSLDVVRANSQKSLAKTKDLTPFGDTETPFPQISLKEKVNGQAAIDALGDKLPLLAKAYDMSTERLENILKTDLTA